MSHGDDNPYHCRLFLFPRFSMTCRRFPAWLATLALLTHLLAMANVGLPGSAQRAEGHPETTRHAQARAEHHAAHAAHADMAPLRHSGHGLDHGATLQCCSAGFSGLAALPFDPPRLPALAVLRRELSTERNAAVPLPRELRPALNPRASPLV